MALIETEADWFACDEPVKLSMFAHDRVNSQRFARLAVDWAARRRHLLAGDYLLWFDAFAAWVAGTGAHPSQVCPEPGPMETRRLAPLWGAVSCYIEAIQRDDPMWAAMCAGCLASMTDSLPWDEDPAVLREFCDHFRDVAGNPFRPVEFRPAWLSADAVGLAHAIDAAGRHERLPVLADALEEAGCDAAEVLGHCRGPGPHARGCWVVDGVLGRGP